MNHPVPAGIVNVHRLASYCAGFAIYFLFCTPSIKLFLPTEAINIVPVLLLLCTAVLRPPVSVSRTGGLVMGVSMALFTVLFSFGVYNSASVDAVSLVKYMILCFLAIAVPLLADAKAIKLAVILIGVWGVVIALVQLGHGFVLNRDKGQNYLTVGYSLGSGSLLGALAAITARRKLVKLLGLACFVLAISATTTLLGRGPLILPLLVLILYLLANAVLEPRLRKWALGAAGLAAVVILVLIYLSQVLAAVRALNRLSRLSHLASEPRVRDVYIPAAEAVANHPWGIGLAAHERLLGGYPHNIFLELLISGGVVAFLLFLLLVCLFFRHAPVLLRDNVSIESKLFFLLCTYYFLAWNLSFSFSSAYAVLPVITFFASRSASQIRELAEARYDYEFRSVTPSPRQSTHEIP